MYNGRDVRMLGNHIDLSLERVFFFMASDARLRAERSVDCGRTADLLYIVR
jgi:hypothetical protein